jgi:hypothetical protein
MADKPNSAPDMTADDVMSVGSQGPEAAVPNPYDDKKAIAVFGSNPAEPHHLSLLVDARVRILAR